LAAELSSRLANMVQEVESEFRKKLDTILDASLHTQEMEVHAAADRILNGVVARATAAGYDLAHASTAARADTDVLERAHVGLTQKLSTAEQSLNQISEQFKSAMNQTVSLATEQMNRHATLACELAEPLPYPFQTLGCCCCSNYKTTSASADGSFLSHASCAGLHSRG
jgi:hypothetical protein